jgi:hypothetical protein
MTTIASLFATGLLVWFALLAVLIIMRVLNGDIFATGMLLQSESDSSVAPERVLVMASFPAVIVGYAMIALHADVSTAHPSLPDVPETLISLLTGGNAVYLAGKVARGT